MADDDLNELLGPALAGAFAKQGYTTLTAVQRAVLAPSAAGRDLRISSQTGSGKTLALGFALRDLVAEPAKTGNVARPHALVVVPTRELAKQVDTELGWLFAALAAKVASVIGGGNYRDERRALSSGPAVVVGTPGRLLDHLNRGAIDASETQAIVLDEADQMLDLGFRDELESILKFAPEKRRTHLVSATFPRDVRALADRVQTDPMSVEGTKLGAANTDIEHVIHLVQPKERVDAIVNILLSTPGAGALVFVKTRADVGLVADELSQAGFRVSTLSGEMEQPERTRALAAFKRGALDALIATDVAARGIDADVARVIHAEPPVTPDAYTHRSGRTGRAGKKGTSSVLVVPSSLHRTTSLLKRAGVRWEIAPVPTAASIRAARDERMLEELTGELAVAIEASDVDPRAKALAKRIAEAGHAERALERLLSRSASGQRVRVEPEPRDVTPIVPKPSAPPREAPRRDAPRLDRDAARPGREGPRLNREDARPARGDVRPHDEAPRFNDEAPRRKPRAADGPTERKAPPGPGWVSFRVTWGQAHGADIRRLLAMMCRRGNIRGSDVGTIKVARSYSVVEIAAPVADAFAQAASQPDPRDPRVKIEPAADGPRSGSDAGANDAERTPTPRRVVDEERTPTHRRIIDRPPPPPAKRSAPRRAK